MIPEFDKEIEVVYPRQNPERFSLYYDGLALKASFGKITIGYAPGNAYAYKRVFPDNLDILFLADLPFPHERFANFIKEGAPKRVAISFRKPSSWVMDQFYMGKLLDGRSIQFSRKAADLHTEMLRTDKLGAIEAGIRNGRLSIIGYLQEGT